MYLFLCPHVQSGAGQAASGVGISLIVVLALMGCLASVACVLVKNVWVMSANMSTDQHLNTPPPKKIGSRFADLFCRLLGFWMLLICFGKFFGFLKIKR